MPHSSAHAGLTNALEMTGCKDEADLIDMANVGKALLDAITTYVKAPSLIENWHPADCPTEIVGDLYNLFDESIACHRADLDRLHFAKTQGAQLLAGARMAQERMLVEGFGVPDLDKALSDVRGAFDV